MFRPLVTGASLLCLLSISQNARCQQPWQQMQNPTTAEVKARWLAPPPEYGPQPYYELAGAVSLPQVERDLDTLHSLGFQALTVQAGFGMPFAYLSPEYFAFFRSFVAEAKKRNMRIWIVDDAGYPSGFAGGKFSSEAPSLRMQTLEVTQKIPLAADGSLHIDVAPNVVSAAAIDVIAQQRAAVPVPIANHHIDWTAPAGSWIVQLVSHEFRTSPTRSETNPQRVKDTAQSLEDYLDPAATRQFLNFTHEGYKQAVGDEFGKTILGFRGDEPDYSVAGLPWTPKFFARFQQIKGYDIQPLAALLIPSPKTDQEEPRLPLSATQLLIKADYYDVFSRMFAEAFFRQQAEWCAANHLEYQVHLNHEEREIELSASEGSFFRAMQPVQVPGVDAIWHQIWTDTISDFPRLASSVAHVYGRPRALTESFAAYRPMPDVAMARYILNEQFVRGINMVEMMHFPATSAGPAPPPAYMGQQGFAQLVTYVRRMSYLLSMGHPDASVALLLPTSSLWLEDEVADTTFVSAERLLSEHQIDFDVVSEDALESDLKATPGGLETSSGNQYRTIFLPAPSILSDSVKKRLMEFAQGGGKVVFLGATPKWIAAKAFRDARAATSEDFQWATVVHAQLPATPTPPAYPPAGPPAPQAVPDEILSALKAAVPTPTVATASPEPALRVMKRRWRDADVYLLFNESAKAIDNEISLGSAGNSVESWDGETGRATVLHSTQTTLRLALPAYAMRVLVVRGEKPR